jgi:hypothetical protein
MAEFNAMNKCLIDIQQAYLELEGNERAFKLWHILGEFEDNVTKEHKVRTAEKIKEEIDHYIDMVS